MRQALLVLTLLSSSAVAEPFSMYSPDDPAYAKVVRNYGKEMIAAKYGARLCADYGVRYRKEYFYNAPPNLWPNERYDAFMSAAMLETKNMMEKREKSLGHDKFCKSFIKFVIDTHDRNNLPIDLK